MAILPIRICGDPVLHTQAAPVPVITPDIRDLVRDLFDTMDAAPGVGLAAPQVGVGLRIFTYGWADDAGHEWRGVAINPELLISPPPTGAANPDDESEGCLSFPGERFPLRRAHRAVLTALDLTGAPFTLDATGWLARILQHEFDHLDGALYIDRLSERAQHSAARIARKQSWGVPGRSWQPGVDNIEP